MLCNGYLILRFNCIEQPSETILKHAVENINTYLSFDFPKNVVSQLIISEFSFLRYMLFFYFYDKKVCTYSYINAGKEIYRAYKNIYWELKAGLQILNIPG